MVRRDRRAAQSMGSDDALSRLVVMQPQSQGRRGGFVELARLRIASQDPE